MHAKSVLATGADADYAKTRRALAEFYAAHVLVRAPARIAAIAAGAASFADLTPSALGA
jgi:hypothetical protein